MAIDELLLANGPEASLRFYEWAPRAVSIGYFQPVAPFQALPDSPRLVRRTTGGGAIDHSDELTFALAIDAEQMPKELNAGYRLVHDVIQNALAAVGIACERHGRGNAAPRPEQLWCFAKPTCHDLITTEGKIMGSAQRRTRALRPRVLHHGSIVLRSPRWPSPPCGSVETQREVSRELVDDLIDRVAKELSTSLERECVAQPHPQPTELEATIQAVEARLKRR